MPEITYRATYKTAAALAGTVETILGGTIWVRERSTLALFFDYTAGSEGTVFIVPYFQPYAGGNYQWQTFSATAGDRAATANRLQLGATGKYYIQLDVRGIEGVVLYHDVAGTVIGGTLGIEYALTDR